MKLKELRNIHFDASTKLLAESTGRSASVLRTWFCQNREVLELKDGRFIMPSDKTVIIDVSKKPE